MSTITSNQVKLVRAAQNRLGLSDAEYRMILRSTAHVESTKDLDQRGFESVLAVFESQGWQDTNRQPGHWSNQSSGKATSRQIRYLESLALKCPRYPLDREAKKISHGRTSEARQLTTREAHKLIEMFKAAAAREGDTPQPTRSQPMQRSPQIDPVDPVRDEEVPF